MNLQKIQQEHKKKTAVYVPKEVIQIFLRVNYQKKSIIQF